MEKQIKTYNFSHSDSRFLDLCKEAAAVYNEAMRVFWETVTNEDKWLREFDLYYAVRDCFPRLNLHSDSYNAAIQQFSHAIQAWRQARKVNSEAKAPHRTKSIVPIYFKQSQIRVKNGKLLLTLDRYKNYLTLPWNADLPLPIYASISYNKGTGWRVNLTLEFDADADADAAADLNQEKILAVDLGVKRIATTYDGQEVVTHSGKTIMALNHYRNKVQAQTQAKLAEKIKGSKRYKKICRAKRKAQARLNNIKNNILRKQAKYIVDYCKDKKIGTIVFGDCAGIHTETNLGKVNNQKVQQNQEQQLRKYITEKFEGIAGQVKLVPEHYTSKSSPICGAKHKPSNREFRCKSCGYSYDRDGVGAINIYYRSKLNQVSFDTTEGKTEVDIGRIRLLIRPDGVKYHENLSYIPAMSVEHHYWC